MSENPEKNDGPSGNFEKISALWAHPIHKEHVKERPGEKPKIP